MQKVRKGLSLVEVVISMLIIVFTASVVITTAAALSKNIERNNNFIRLNAYINSTLNEIYEDVDSAKVIEGIDYNKNGQDESKIISVVTIKKAGNAFGREVFVVDINARIKGTTDVVSTQAIVRRGAQDVS